MYELRPHLGTHVVPNLNEHVSPVLERFLHSTKHTFLTNGLDLSPFFALPLVAAFIRGAVQPMAKAGLAEWPDPFAAVTLGYLVSALMVLTVSAIRERGRPAPFHRSGWLWFSAVGLCNGVAVWCSVAEMLMM